MHKHPKMCMGTHMAAQILQACAQVLAGTYGHAKVLTNKHGKLLRVCTCLSKSFCGYAHVCANGCGSVCGYSKAVSTCACMWVPTNTCAHICICNILSIITGTHGCAKNGYVLASKNVLEGTYGHGHVKVLASMHGKLLRVCLCLSKSFCGYAHVCANFCEYAQACACTHERVQVFASMQALAQEFADTQKLLHMHIHGYPQTLVHMQKCIHICNIFIGYCGYPCVCENVHSLSLAYIAQCTREKLSRYVRLCSFNRTTILA